MAVLHGGQHDASPYCWPVVTSHTFCRLTHATVLAQRRVLKSEMVLQIKALCWLPTRVGGIRRDGAIGLGAVVVLLVQINLS